LRTPLVAVFRGTVSMSWKLRQEWFFLERALGGKSSGKSHPVGPQDHPVKMGLASRPATGSRA
jgi:hypothetical protein